jgi:hypothetical protein
MIFQPRTAEKPVTPIGRANAILIRYPRFNQLHDDIRLCQEISKIAGEAQCMVLEGMPGAGKSTLVQSYAATFPRYGTESGTKVPVFYLETPSPATVKGMAARFLEVLGDPAANRGTLWSMNSRLIHFLRACEVQLVILDDFHHLIDKETNRVLEKVSDWLKVLVKETHVPFLVVGLEGTVRRILNTNAQLSRLFAIRATLHPFQWEPHRPETIQEFARFVAFTEQEIGLPLSDEIAREDLLYRLHDATHGIVGNLMNLLRFSVVLAERNQRKTLTLDILSAAFDLRLAEHVRKASPFSLSMEEPTVKAQSNAKSADEQATSYLQKDDISISDALTTR